MTALKRSLFSENYCSKFLYVEEIDGNVSADFLISSIIVDQFQSNPNAGMCLVLFHNTFSHYSNICARTNFRLSLPDLVQNNQLVCIQALETVTEALIKDKTENLEDQDLSSFNITVETGVNRLVEKGVSHIYLVIESISNLFYLAHSLKSVMNFFLNCYNNILNQSAATLVLSSHICDVNSDQKLLSAFLKHMSDINIRVSGLKTGFSSEVSGNFIVERKISSLYSFHIKKDKFYFKLEDNAVMIYDGIAPNFLK